MSEETIAYCLQSLPIILL